MIETYEPELGVLSDHRYHYPPPSLLIHAVAHIARGAPSPATRYNFRDAVTVDYVVVGPFARYVGLYGDARPRRRLQPGPRTGPVRGMETHPSGRH